MEEQGIGSGVMGAAWWRREERRSRRWRRRGGSSGRAGLPPSTRLVEVRVRPPATWPHHHMMMKHHKQGRCGPHHDMPVRCYLSGLLALWLTSQARLKVFVYLIVWTAAGGGEQFITPFPPLTSPHMLSLGL